MSSEIDLNGEPDPGHLSPSAIAEYISKNQCSRFAKHAFQDIDRSQIASGDEYDEAFNPLNILLSHAGEEFETTILEQCESATEQLIRCEESDDDAFYQNHTDLIDGISTAIERKSRSPPVVFYQPGLSGQISTWDVQGDADLIFVWPTDDGADVRVVDIKRASEEKVEHQIQSAIYADLLSAVLEQTRDDWQVEFSHDERRVTETARSSEKGSTTTSGGPVTIRVSAGVITWESDFTPLTQSNVPSFGVESRVMDTRRLLRVDGPITTALGTEFDTVPHQLNTKCNNCAYNEACVSDAFAEGHTRLLGISASKQRKLRTEPGGEGIGTVAELADAVSVYPDVDEWTPTTYQDHSFKRDPYNELEGVPGIGDELAQLVYQARGLVDTFAPDEDEREISDRPVNWLPGTGRCQLPDDDPHPDTGFEYEFKHGSMIRVYLNIQHDQLRDRLIHLSARITATESDAEPQRISVLSEDAPEDIDTATDIERDLLASFADRLFDGIRTVAAGIEFGNSEYTQPPLHFYTYTEQELEQLVEAFDRHEPAGVETINAFRDAIEPGGRPDDQMVSAIMPEVSDHLILETPSTGLIHVFEEVYPSSDAYSKSLESSEWEYSPPDSEKVYDLRSVFGRRLFNIGISCSRDGETIQTDPSELDIVDGVNTRVRYDAAIPLGYHWTAIDKLTEEWLEGADASALEQYNLDIYQYRDATAGDEYLQPVDLEILGRHICDMIEHVERALIYRDGTITKAPFPLDTLPTDSFDAPPLATGAQRYLQAEYQAGREETYKTYRKFPRQRILSGESIPVEIRDITEVDNRTVRVEGELKYYSVFDSPPDSEKIKSIRGACKRKGSQGTSSGSWMVANEFLLNAPQADANDPVEIERGANATIQYLSLSNREITFTLTNFWGSSGDFGSQHQNWTLDASRRSDEEYLHITEGKDLILDPQTDEITTEWIVDALNHADENALHTRLEQVRHGEITTPVTPLFDTRGNTDGESDELGVLETDTLVAFSDWLDRSSEKDTYPSDTQQSFINNGLSQFLCLQGPPGTGKTAATMAPSLLARAYAATVEGISLNGLITAPSNTAIDEVLEEVSDLLVDTRGEDGPLPPDADIELVRIGRTPDEPIPNVSYVDYNSEDDEGELNRVCDRLQREGHRSVAAARSSETSRRSTDDGQATLTSYNPQNEASTTTNEADGRDRPEPSPAVTLVFATVPRSWRFLRELASSSRPDDVELATQSVWDLLAVDEASMLEIPQLLLAGAGFRSHGQALIAGDHRQLPPVQKGDWDDTRRRDLRATAAYLSTLDYIRLLRGEDVLDDDQLDKFDHSCDRDEVSIPLVQLETTYRFDGRVASLMQRTIYSKDGIPYQSGRERSPLDSVQDPPDWLAQIFGESSVALITYNPTHYHQQSNPVEAIITQSIIQYTTPDTTTGVVTPHNAHRGTLQSQIPMETGDGTSENQWRDLPVRDVQIDTVNRFQGGERDLMFLNATVSDPSYIEDESDFLLQENRINVSLTRHRDTVIVIVPETILGHIPSDPDLYEQATIWKVLASDLGEAPTVPETDPIWADELGYLLADTGWECVPDFIRPLLSTDVEIYNY